ncbi:hypothetical protein FBU30_011289 [Linnemannia zychae]|nr:hypothetical protein FBU30_011289 [Linnemannia zychae]
MAGHNICNVVRSHLLKQERPRYLQPKDIDGNYPWEAKQSSRPCLSGSVGGGKGKATMTISESILPLRSHPNRSMECFSSSEVTPQRAAKLLAENEEKWNNSKMLIGLFEFDDEVNEWKYTGDIFEHVWTGDWDYWNRDCHFLFNSDASVLYVATRDDNTLYALDATNHLKVVAKVDLPFRPKSHTLALTPKDSALYITSTFPWIVSVYNARTLRLLGTAPSGRYDLDTLDDEYMAKIAKFYNPSTSIAHRHTYLASDDRCAVVVDTPELHCISHKVAYRLSSYVVLIYSGDCNENPWLLDLETLRKVMLDLVEGHSIIFQSADSSKIVFKTEPAQIYEVLQDQLITCLDTQGHLSAEAPTTISVNAAKV